MGKNKEQKTELLNAFSRMNYLYQAAVVISKTTPNAILSNYYGKIMKEVSKKVVEKIHPDVKRALCLSCSYPLFRGGIQADVKIKPARRKSKKRTMKGNHSPKVKKMAFPGHDKDYKLSQLIRKNSKPNRLLWNCNRCGYTRTFMQRPSHYLWINKIDEIHEL